MTGLSCLDAAPLPADAIEVGRILGAWGVKGWLKIQPYSLPSEALFSSKRWLLQSPDRQGAAGFKAFTGTVLLRVMEAKEHADTVVAQAEGLSDRDAAQSLKGARIFVPRSSFPTPELDEFYWVDLIGLAVVNRDGVDLGRVTELLSTGPQAVLVLEAEENGERRERMIPFVSAYVDAVDLAARRITVDWGLDF